MRFCHLQTLRRATTNLEFQACLNICDLQDIRWPGYKFTWCNRQSGVDRIEERLDRFYANNKWLEDFRSWEV